MDSKKKNLVENDPFTQRQIDNIRIKPSRILKTAIILYIATLILIYINKDSYTDTEIYNVVMVGLYGVGGIVALTYLFGLLSKYIIKLSTNKTHK